MKHIVLSVALLAGAISANAADYLVNVPLADDDEGAMAYIVDFDTDERIDSVIVSENHARFHGTVDTPMIARLIIDGQRKCTFFVESGSITVDTKSKTASGSPLNDKANEFSDYTDSIASNFRNAASEEEQMSIYDGYIRYRYNEMIANMDNAFGYYLFLNAAYDMSPEEFTGIVEKYPYLKERVRVKKLIETNERKLATSPGNMFTDFEVTYDGVTKKLSDYVGRGEFVLVDFWASWCGPCIRETATIKELYNEYDGKGLKVLGVAVWDEPENTLNAIKTHELPWECILNAQTIPTDLYGISGIPCIILFGPDGKILIRDKQGEDLKNAVRSALSGK